MVIDLLFAIIVVFAVIKGYQRGLIVGLFSLVAVIIGLAAALKLSATVATHLEGAINVSKEWLPFISFALVFLVVILLIRLGAKLVEGTVKIAMLGWLNRLGGILLFLVIYTLVFSVVLFYAVQMDFLKTGTVAQSATYDFIGPLGPKVINTFASLVPWFKDMFAELQEFFGNFSGTQSM